MLSAGIVAIALAAEYGGSVSVLPLQIASLLEPDGPQPPERDLVRTRVVGRDPLPLPAGAPTILS